MSATPGSGMPAFSYAQAAKGLAPTTANAAHSAVEATLTPHDNLPKDRKSRSHDTSKAGSESESTSIKSDKSLVASDLRSTSNSHTTSSTTKDTGNKENLPPLKQSPSSTHEVKLNALEKSSPSSGAAISSTLPKEEETLPNHDDPSEAWEKQSQISASVEKAAQQSGSNRMKESEDDWERVSVSKMSTERELKAAPIPPVNIWQARKEAQEAKAKALAAHRPAPSQAAVVKPKSPPNPTPEIQKGLDDEPRRKAPTKSSSASEREESFVRRRQSDVPKARDETRKQQPRQSRSPMNETSNAETSPPPPVGDAESWPTPELAITEERKKSISIDRQEKGDARQPGSKAKQWVPVPYVPSAKFVTPLPPAVTRRGGRSGARGGREPVSGNSHTARINGVEKSDTARPMGPPPLPKQVIDQDRGRNQDSSGSNRATSAPTQSTRATSVGESSGGQMKDTADAIEDPHGGESGVPSALDSLRASDQPSEDVSTSRRSRGDSKSFIRPSNFADPSNRRGSIERSAQSTFSADAHSHPKRDPTARRSFQPEYYRPTEEYGNAEWSASSKERDLQRPRENGKERQEMSREKSASWRDRDTSFEREVRPERTRGSYRGRGGHSTYPANPPTHAFTAPLPQQPFLPGKSHSYQNSHRQPSQPYPALSSQQSQRVNARSLSIPTNVGYSSVNNHIQPMQQALSPIQTEMPMYAYPQPIHPGIMSAVPYNAALDSYALLALVHSQLEYYFSIDNLCKDLFLRQHMDSQGWVLLSVIAGFKRIKALTEDPNVLRQVCSQLKSIEFRPGDDGVDRLRKKDGWEQWVRPMSERVPEARNDGPSGRSGSSEQGISATQNFMHQEAVFTSPTFQSTAVWAPDSYREDRTTNHIETSRRHVPAPLNTNVSETSAATNIPELPSNDTFSLSNGGVTAAGGQTELDNTDQRSLPNVPTEELANGHVSVNAVNTRENVFADEQIASLVVVVKPETPSPSMAPPPFINESSRTFSHGSIDGGTLSTDAHMGGIPSPNIQGLRGGFGTVEQLENGRPQQLQNPGQLAQLNYQTGSLPVFWVKDGAPLIGLHQQGLSHEAYESLHARALQQRQYGDNTADMEVLYQFWSHFLVRNFNVSIYKEFRKLALEDASRGLGNGISHVLKYYDALLSGQTPLTDRLAHDIVDLVSSDLDESRAAFQKLRAAWRNGAFNLKSRKKIDTIITAKLREELEA